jgi:hypothetical protein
LRFIVTKNADSRTLTTFGGIDGFVVFLKFATSERATRRSECQREAAGSRSRTRPRGRRPNGAQGRGNSKLTEF